VKSEKKVGRKRKRNGGRDTEHGEEGGREEEADSKEVEVKPSNEEEKEKEEDERDV
jgi:hypothetical protein